MTDELRGLNAEVIRLCDALLAERGEDGGFEIDIVKIIRESAERMAARINDELSKRDEEFWLHDLRAPAASMASAANLLIDEIMLLPGEPGLESAQTLRAAVLRVLDRVDIVAAAMLNQDGQGHD